MSEIIINNIPVTVKEYQEQRVVTFKDIDTISKAVEMLTGENVLPLSKSEKTYSATEMNRKDQQYENS